MSSLEKKSLESIVFCYQLFSRFLVNSIGKILGVNQPEELILPLTIFFLIATISSGFVRYLFNFYALRVSSNIGSDLSINAYKTSINRPYKYHLSKNSNILITTITKDISEIVYFIFNPSFFKELILFAYSSGCKIFPGSETKSLA